MRGYGTRYPRKKIGKFPKPTPGVNWPNSTVNFFFVFSRVGKDLLSFFVFFRESREKKKKNQDFQDFCLFFSGSLEIFEIFEKS